MKSSIDLERARSTNSGWYNDHWKLTTSRLLQCRMVAAALVYLVGIGTSTRQMNRLGQTLKIALTVMAQSWFLLLNTRTHLTKLIRPK